MLLGRNVSELLKTTSSQELSEWRIHLRKHPPWWIRIEAAIAQLCCLYYNSHRARGVPAAKIIDFMLFRDKPKGFTKPRQQQRVFKLLAAMNAANSRKKESNNGNH